MIYMTKDEWKEISKIIEENDFYKLAKEIASRTYDFDISKEELDDIIKDYKSKRRNEYCLRKLIKSMYGREDYLADNVSVISANDTKDPELPDGLALRVQDNYVNKKFDKAVEQVTFLMKDLALKQYKEKESK